jgi:cell shape-determining protein MreD
MPDINIIIGLLGMTLILIAFLLDEFSKTIHHQSWQFNVLNIFGSLLLVYYAYTLNSIPFMILNGVWFIAAIVKITMIKK